MTLPVVSIVLPTYNGSTYLGEAIESCLAQTYPAWELIIVDDCSTDATPALLAQYAARDQRIRVIRHEENRKVPGALNTGHAAARGSYEPQHPRRSVNDARDLSKSRRYGIVVGLTHG